MNDLSVKALIGIDIIKSKSILLDTDSNLVTIESYSNLQISISIVAKGSRTDIVIVIKARFTVLVHFFLIVFIKPINLSINKDLIFELE